MPPSHEIPKHVPTMSPSELAMRAGFMYLEGLTLDIQEGALALAEAREPEEAIAAWEKLYTKIVEWEVSVMGMETLKRRSDNTEEGS